MNITLIGMPASGKSVVGVLLAKRLNMRFVDADLLIQDQEGCLLKDIIERDGLDGFLAIENQVNRDIKAENTIISPGGSVVYGKEAMDHLKEISTVVYLKVSMDDLLKRLGNLKDRGVAIAEGQTFADLYRERVALYERYADVTVDENGKDAGMIVDELRDYFTRQ
ncbi:MAG: shikimate kinase [Lachnospiraceae bacterium]|nr:shikimate kinase [Lachnospiraceae bacterium]